MKTITIRMALVLGAVAGVLGAHAQTEMDPWQIVTDVDGDGIVGPTDIQQVINAALGIRDAGPDGVALHTRHYVVASPRASLAPVPVHSGEPAAGIGITPPEPPAPCGVIGAVENFPRRQGRLLVRTGTTAVFRYDRNVEGVWYAGACGLLRTELIVELAPVPAPEPSEGEGELAGEGAEEGGDPVDPDVINLPELEFVEVGRDGAQGRGCGPRVGTANIGVRHEFTEPGDYVVRANIGTAAVPMIDDGGVIVPDECGAVRKFSRAFVLVRVIEGDPTPEDLEWEHLGRVGEVPHQYNQPLTHELEVLPQPLP